MPEAQEGCCRRHQPDHDRDQERHHRHDVVPEPAPGEEKERCAQQAEQQQLLVGHDAITHPPMTRSVTPPGFIFSYRHRDRQTARRRVDALQHRS
jgi:hypothetical protein